MSAAHAVDDVSARIDVVRRNAARFVDLARRAPDPDVPVPGMDWTVGQLIAHVVAMGRNHAAMARRAGRPYRSVDSIAVENEEMLAELGRVGAGDVQAAADDLAVAFAEYPADQPFHWHAGIDVDLSTEVGIAAGEYVLHGGDLARALSRSWPVDAGDACVVVDAALVLGPSFVDSVAAAGVHFVYDIRLRGGPRYRVAFADGTMTTERVDGKVRDADCRVSADPAAFMLVAFGRRSPWWAAARGKVVAFGKKPWLGLRFGRLVKSP